MRDHPRFWFVSAGQSDFCGNQADAHRDVLPAVTIGTVARERWTAARRGVTLIELLVVMTIILIMMSLLLPALQAARRRATETVCENNLHQVSIAMCQYVNSFRRLPSAAATNSAGGWSVVLLEFLEQRDWQLQLQKTPSLNPVSLSTYATRRPSIMTCPVGNSEASTIAAIPIGHYILAIDSARSVWQIGDSPKSFHGPWVSGPEMAPNGWDGQDGPHSGGFYVANSDGSVVYRAK